MNYKALVSFYSQEHGAVSAGSEMTIKNKDLAKKQKICEIGLLDKFDLKCLANKIWTMIK